MHVRCMQYVCIIMYDVCCCRDGSLSVTVKSASKLPNVETGRESDPFTILTFKGIQKKTNHIENTCNPSWNEVTDYVILIFHHFICWYYFILKTTLVILIPNYFYLLLLKAKKQLAINYSSNRWRYNYMPFAVQNLNFFEFPVLFRF